MPLSLGAFSSMGLAQVMENHSEGHGERVMETT